MGGMTTTQIPGVPGQRRADPAGHGTTAPGSGRIPSALAAHPTDLPALRLWLLSRVSVFLLVGAGAWVLTFDRQPVPYLTRWNQWDTGWFVQIAQFGYRGDPAHPPHVPLEAFLPGFPMLLRLGHALTGLDFIWFGLLVSLVAGCVAAVALARIAASYARPGQERQLAERTVLIFAIAPSTIFLSAAYTDALFLGLALPAWLAARKGNWTTAAVLTAAAGLVRMQGLFLALALIVEFALQRGRTRSRWAPLNLGLAFVGPVGYMAWLHGRTGDWMAWSHAQERGWGRHTVAPWHGLHNALRGRFDGTARTDFAWMYSMEISTLVIGLVLTVWLIRNRRWAEATFVGLQVFTLATDSLWQSYDRYALTWWPFWIALAGWSLHRKSVLQGLLVLFAPLAVTCTLVFSTGRWAG
jgi:hypothetical protein